MTIIQMISIARRALMLAANTVGGRFDYYREYMDQLRSGDYQCLRQWIGCMVEEGDQRAIDIMKMLIRARLRRAAL